MRRLFSLIILCVAVVAATAADIDRLVLTGRRISTVNGLSSNTVYDILQDKKGFVWMGAAYGLCRYDGYSFRNFYSLSSDDTKKVDANVGKLYEDREGDLLWIHTATYNMACYDMRKGLFIDYTGRNDDAKPFRRLLRSGRDLWLYDLRFGLRHVACRGQRTICTDYNAENGLLPSNHIPRVVEDGAHHIWIITDKALLVTDSTGRMRTVAQGRYVEGNCHDGQFVCLTAGNTVEVYDSQTCRLKRRISIPSALGMVDGVRSNFVWRGRWMIFCHDTYSIDLRTGRVERPADLQISNGLLLDAIDGYFFESNADGALWVFTPKGDVKRMRLIPDVKFTSERSRLYSMARDRNGLFYIATYGNGLFVYDPDSDRSRHFTASDPQPAIDTNVLTGIMTAADGTVWVLEESAGVACIAVADQSIASFVLPAPDHKGDWANSVRMVAKGKDGAVVFCTRDNRLSAMNTTTGEVSTLADLPSCAYSYLVDSKGRTWIATRNDGLYVDGTRYMHNDPQHPLPARMLYCVKEDPLGRVWIATYEEGLLLAETAADGSLTFRTLLKRQLNESRQHDIAIDKYNRLWVATNNGIYVADCHKRNISNEDFRNFNPSNSTFPLYEVNCLMCAADGSLWAGGKGGGAVRVSFSLKEEAPRCDTLTREHGLANNTVNALLQDRFGTVWVATASGLSAIYDNDMKVKTYTLGKELQRNIYSEGAAVRLDDGRLAFGTLYGLTIVTPRRFDNKQTERHVAVNITDLRINGSQLDNEKDMLSPGYADEIRLSHNRNTVAIYFSDFDYADTGSSLYQYYLEGYDKEWRPMTSLNHVEYGNLEPGRYTFHIRALSGNQWSGERTLTIIIEQPWYNTWWAWAIYLSLAIAATLYIYVNARERLRLHQQLKLDKQLTEFRLNFFTNIAHEFRTPLAIIQGAIDKLNADSNASRQALQTARRGTRRLLKLVNQLMEFRKMNTGNMRLQVEHDDIIGFIRNIYQDFWNLSKQRDMHISFTPFAKQYDVPFDHSMVETMVYNLLSNAVKYTPRGGHITVTLTLQDERLVFAVADDGPGISDEQQRSLFQPFMQGNVSQGGMGIGLYTAHGMALLHKGSLVYERVADGGGSLFTLTIPATATAYANSDYKLQTAVATTTDTDEKADEMIREMLPEALNDISVAIVEDDADMMEQIRGELGKYFHVDSYIDGESAIEGIAKNKPALVVCDVMLPGINGYDVVKKLKADDSLSTVPVIMLTALDDDRHQLRSYGVGADDYMVKPCNFKLLVGRALQLIQQSRRIALQLSRAATTAKASNNEIEAVPGLITNNADKQTLQRMQYIIAQHISDPNFSVDQLASLMNMGRTKLFTKTKELVGMSPNKFLQNERMRIAAELLAQGELNVAEVCYKVGMQDASYFNKCFKAKYGVVPSKYKG